MKIFEKISNGYKRIAAGIAIVAFFTMMYLALIPGASYAHVYGPDGGILSGVYVFIKEWPQYNTTTDIDGTYAINNVPYGEYTLVAMGNDSYAPNISNMYVTQASNPKDITLKAAKKYYMPFLYQRSDHVGSDYNASIQLQNSGTTNASVEMILFNTDSSIAGNDFIKVNPGELLIKQAPEVVGSRNIYVGPGFIKSDSNVQVQGYIKTTSEDVYSIAPSIGNPTTNAYVPFLYQRSDHVGFDYDSGFQIFNPGTSNASVNIKLYETNGTIAYNNTYTVGSKIIIGPSVASMLPGRTIYVGPAEITSDNPILAQGYIRTTNSKIYSIAPSLDTTVTRAYIPFLYQRSDHVGFDYDAGFQIFNPGTSSASVNIKLYEINGSLAYNNTYTVGSKIIIGPSVASMLSGRTIYVGPAEITSDNPVVVQGYIRTAGSNVYSVAPQVRKPGSVIDIHIPYIYSTISNSHDAGIQVMNPNAVSADISINYYYKNGTVAGTYSTIINSNQTVGPAVFAVVGSANDFEGYGIVSANQSVLAQGYIRTRGTKNIYGIAPPVER